MFCYKCGNQIEDGALFCPFCGEKQEVKAIPQGTEATPAAAPVAAAPVFEQQAEPTFPQPEPSAEQPAYAQPVGGAQPALQPKKKVPIWVWIVGGVVILLAIAAVLYFVVFNKKSKTVEELNNYYCSVGSEWKLENDEYVYHMDLDKIGYTYTLNDFKYDYNYYASQAEYYSDYFNEKSYPVKIIASDSQGEAMIMDNYMLTFVRDDYQPKHDLTLEALNAYFDQSYVEWKLEDDHLVCYVDIPGTSWSGYSQDTVISDSYYIQDTADDYAVEMGEDTLPTRLIGYDSNGTAIICEEGTITYIRDDYDKLYDPNYVDPNAETTPETTPAATIEPKTEDGYIVKIGESYYANAKGGLMLREGPGTTYKALYKIEKGTLLKAEETKDNWMKVTVGGYTGWCCTDYIVAYKKNMD